MSPPEKVPLGAASTEAVDWHARRYEHKGFPAKA
jgi:hypothetical protein